MPGSFFDTNVLLYAVSADAAKSERATVLLRAGGTISVQNLNEYANVARKKLSLPWTRIQAYLNALQIALAVVPVTIAIYERGIGLAERFGFAVHDAMIVAAALETRCTTLWSEDMQHGLRLEGGLRILNPFLPVI
jgi:predicted nucleic acid-binding protein